MHSFGADRVTLARELSLEEVRTIREQTEFPLEIFVHGALCVAYSGQCFSSEAWGGRSANRGQCAQACRLPYELMVDGRHEPLGDARYLLSPGDLYTLKEISEIVTSGVSALKIEGRYKDAEYVTVTTRAYRTAVDDAWAGKPHLVSRTEEIQLEQVYSRGLGPYFVTGTNHQAVVRGRAPRHRGVLMGRVARSDADSVTIETNESHEVAPLKEGDGIVFDAADWRSPEEPEEGGRIYEATAQQDGKLRLRFANRAVRFDRVRPGDLVWRTSDSRPLPTAEPHRQPVRVRVSAQEGSPLIAEWSLVDRPDVSVTVSSASPLATAQSRAISIETLREQFGRLGNTAYDLGEISLDSGGAPFAPVSVLNQMRREAVDQLQALQTSHGARVAHDPVAALDAARPAPQTSGMPANAELHLLVRTPEQLDAAIDLAPSSITLDYLDLYGLRPSVERVKASGIAARVASPRVLKPGEARITNFLLSLGCQILVRPTGILHAFHENDHPFLIGDFSLNAANSLSAAEYLKLVSRLTPTHDLNAAQIADLARDVGAENLEVIAYQHLPVFHTEHCVFCRFLSNGTSYKDCGRPCEKHRVELRDGGGRSHPVMADVGCRNTVFGAEAQEASAYLELWRAAGIRHFRLEFVHESGSQVREVAGLFRLALNGDINVSRLRADLRAIAPQGTTQGSLFVPSGYLELPVL